MQTLSATLEAAQQAMGDAITKIVLTHNSTTYTYTESDRIISIKHSESDDSQTAEVLLNNSDQALSSLDLMAYSATISSGYTTSEGDEYSATPPLIVIDQDFYSAGGVLVCKLSLAGNPDMLEVDKASDDYDHFASSSKTVKDLIDEVLDGTAVSEDLTEEQTAGGTDAGLSLTVHACGQKLLILERTVKTLSFRLRKVGSATGDIRFVIRDSQDISDIQNEVWADASTLTTSYAWCTKTFTTPVEVEDEVYIYPLYSDGDADNYVEVEYKNSNVKQNENLVALGSPGGWTEWSNYDCAYRYTYSGGGIGVFSHCESYTATYDSEDSLIDVYTPKDAFTIAQGESRMSVIKRLLAYTACKMIFKADGNPHIFEPTTTGTSYDYEYSTDSGHGFFNKSLRNALVIPNYIVVASYPEDEDQYTGYATDSTSNALLDIRDYERMRLTSNAQATSIAEAMIASLQIESQRGACTVPMNVGAEVYDYVKVTDSWENDTRTGNIGYITRYYEAGRFEMEFGFGKMAFKGIMGTRPSLISRTQAETNSSSLISSTWNAFKPIFSQIDDNFNNFGAWRDKTDRYIKYLLNKQPEIPEIWQDQVTVNNYIEIDSRGILCRAVAFDEALSTGDGINYIPIPSEFHDWDIIAVAAYVHTVSSSGAITIQLYNMRHSHNILSTAITIDAGDYNSYDASTAAVINTSYDDVDAGDRIRVDCSGAGTDTEGLDIKLWLKKPES